MTSTLLDVPAHHAFEYREILANAEIEYKIHKRLDSVLTDSVLFEIIASTEKRVFAENILTEMDTYSAVTFVTSRKLKDTLDRASYFELEVASNTIVFRILDKPYLHRIELKGVEAALNRYFDKNMIHLTASRGGSGKGTVAYPIDYVPGKLVYRETI
jgi:arsenate reductase-like glutaredoxin family protein